MARVKFKVEGMTKKKRNIRGDADAKESTEIRNSQ